MNRRGFLGSILALGMAPAVVKAGVLMPVRPLVVLPTLDERMAINNRAAGALLASLREEARAALSLWWGEQFDRLTLDYLLAQDAPPLQLNRIVVAR